jgi:hypothetical protein
MTAIFRIIKPPTCAYESVSGWQPVLGHFKGERPRSSDGSGVNPSGSSRQERCSVPCGTVPLTSMETTAAYMRVSEAIGLPTEGIPLRITRSEIV